MKPPQKSHNFKEVGKKGKKELRCLFDIKT
jgi:hypothetical protein